MYTSSLRSTTRTASAVIALVAVLSLLLSAVALVRPVGATEVVPAADHCPGSATPGAPPGAINSSSGSETEQSVTIAWAGDPGEVTLTNANDTTATVVFCAKGGNDFDSGSQTSGELTIVLAPDGEPGAIQTVTFGTEISYFVLYTVTVEPPDDECVTATSSNRLGVTGDIPGVNEPGMPAGHPSTWSVSGSVSVPDGVCVEIHLTSYTLPSGRMQPFGDQVLHQDSPQSGTFEGPGTFPLTVDVPDGCYQADLYLGPLVLVPPHHGSDRPDTHLFDWQTWQIGPNDTVEDCLPPAEGEIEIRKATNEAVASEEFDFAASWDAEGFTLTKGGSASSGQLAAEADYTVTETLTAEQLAMGWSLDDIDCGEADVEIEGATVTITLHRDDEVICTFTNELAPPDLELVKTGSEPVTAGDGSTVSYTLTVTNEGLGVANDVVLTDDLSATGLSNWEITGVADISAEACEISAEELLTCTVATLLGEQSFSVAVQAETDTGACPSIENDALVVASNEPENDQFPNSASAEIMVSCPQIALEKTNDAVGSVLPGTTVNYTLDLTVSGEDIDGGGAADVEVVDTLPVGLENPTNISDGGTFDATNRTITWDLGDLGAGSYELTYQAVVAAGVANGATLVNAAEATSTNSQCPNAEMLGPECEDTSTVTVRVPTLVIDKVASADVITISGPESAPVASPSIVTWTLSYTLANGPVTGAVITDPIPAGFTFLDAADGGTFAAGSVTWNLGTLSASGSVSFRTTVDAATIDRTDPTVNTATIVSNETAADTGQDSVTVTAEGELGGSPTPTPSGDLPDTAVVNGSGGEPTSLPVLLLVALLMASIGALTMPPVKNRIRHR